MSDDYGFRFASDGMGVNGSHRGDGSKPVPKVTLQTRERAIETGRLSRATTLPIRNVGPRQYVVKGSVEERYWVDLDQSPACTCRDREYRTVQCKHEIAAKLQERDPAVMAALVESYVNRGRRLREAGIEDDNE